VLSEQDVTEALREDPRHLLEADVSSRSRQGSWSGCASARFGALAVKTVSPGQQVVKLVHDEIADCGGHEAGTRLRIRRPTGLLLVGLQGSGKTSTAAKAGAAVKLEQRRRGWMAADPYRPAAARTAATAW